MLRFPMPKLSAQARARKIKLLLFDVDGVLTDGKLFFFPFPGESQSGRIEFKGFHAHDGASISLAAFPRFDPARYDSEAEREIALLQGVVTAARGLLVGAGNTGV